MDKQRTERIDYSEGALRVLLSDTEEDTGECVCPVTGQLFESEEAFDEYLGPRPQTGPDLNLTFAENGFKIDMGSGYQKADTTSYWMVVRDGKPRDLVKEVGKKAYSVIETQRNNAVVGNQKAGDDLKRRRLVTSDYWPRDDEKYDYYALNYQQFISLAASGQIEQFKPRSETAASHGVRHDGNTKRLVLERREGGESYNHIVKMTGVSKKTVLRWCREAGL